jgi:dTDP-glucose pyrophosphorylase/mRNA-degrading endonuclease RelE of RelBE toxin-antitoxin system
MESIKKHLILAGSTVKEALTKLDVLAQDAILFFVDEDLKLIGSLTDGDVRRGLLRGVSIDNKVDEIIQKEPKFIVKGENDINKIIEYREGLFRIVPVVDEQHKIVNIINFRNSKSYLPLDVVIMAGGKGQRLKPLTDHTPKPLLKVGGKAIMEHNVDRLTLYGMDDFWFCINYLGDQIENHFGKGEAKNININYIWENEALGTIGAVSKIDNFQHDYVLVTNSDLLTDVDYEHFFLDFINQDADLAVLTIPYEVNIPYAVLETSNDSRVKSFKEKPTYTYYSNGGVYLIKRKALDAIPKNVHYNATDLMEELIQKDFKVISYPFSGYWLDIGKHEDFNRAQEDIKHIKF